MGVDEIYRQVGIERKCRMLRHFCALVPGQGLPHLPGQVFHRAEKGHLGRFRVVPVRQGDSRNHHVTESTSGGRKEAFSRKHNQHVTTIGHVLTIASRASWPFDIILARLAG